MSRIPVPAIANLPRALCALSLSVLLAACGGGSNNDSTQSSSSVSADAAKNASANTATIPNDSATALSATLESAEAVVAAGSASVSIACAGGGTAVYQVTGPDASLLLNHQLDQGENYSLTFNDCQNASDSATVNGSMTLLVASKTSDSITVDTATNNVVVTLPHGTVTLNGSSTISRTITTSGNTTTTTTHWVTPNFSVVSNRNGKTSSFSFTNVDITRTIVVTNGVVTSTGIDGTSTLSWVWPGGSFSITFATQGTVTCDGNGTPTQGVWSVTFPHDRIIITVVPGTVMVQVDYGNDGTIDRVYTFTVTDLMGSAG